MDKGTSVFVPTLLALLVGGIAAVQNKPVLMSTRPAPEHAVREVASRSACPLQTVPARLWEDPLAVVAKDDESTRRTGEETVKIFKATDLGAKHVECHVLAALVPGAFFADDTEKRLRYRPAVHAALHAAGFSGHDNRHLGCYEVKTCDPAGEVKGAMLIPYEVFTCKGRCATNDCAACLILLWISEAHLRGDPIQKLEHAIRPWMKVLASPWKPESTKGDAFRRSQHDSDAWQPCGDLTEGCSLAPVALLGPSDSGMLASMLADLDRGGSRPASFLADGTLAGGKGPLRGAVMYSPFSTVPPTKLHASLERPPGTEPETGLACTKQEITFQHDGSVVFTVKRTIGTDEDLTRLLVEELALRRAVGPKDKIALLVESDTAYAMELEDGFRRAVKRKLGCDYKSKLVTPYKYTRGMDGITAADKARQQKQLERMEAAGAEQKRGTTPAPRSAGLSRLDYIQRLVKKIKEDGDPAAIGILGSDVYDKLLLLQALRPSFPSSIFFTTDLDALLFDPSVYETTRNLLIASHYGLELAEKLQGDIGLIPFRGSYQAATYLATLAATETLVRRYGAAPNLDAPGHLATGLPYDTLEPRIYEVARSGAFDVTLGQSDSFHPMSHRERSHAAFSKDLVAKLLVGVFAAIIVWLAVTQIRLSRGRRPRSGVSARPFVLGTLAACGLYAFLVARLQGGDADGEPFVLFEGISAWPACVLRVALAGLCLYYVVLVSAQLRASHGNLRRLLGVESPPPPSAPVTKKRWSRYIPFGWWQCGENASIEAICADYERCSSPRHRFVRATLILLVLFGFNVALFSATAFPVAPVRGGDLGMLLYKVPLFLVLILLYFLIGTVGDAITLCISWVRLVSRKNVEWTKKPQDMAVREWNVPRDMARGWLAVQLIGQQSAVVGRFVYYPFVGLLAMIVIHSSIFDGFSRSPSLLVVQAIAFGLLILAATVLILSARSARGRVLARMEEETRAWLRAEKKLSKSSKAKGEAVEPDLSGKRSRRLDRIHENARRLVEGLRGYKEGAYARFHESPIVRAVLIPGGGVGTLALFTALLG